MQLCSDSKVLVLTNAEFECSATNMKFNSDYKRPAIRAHGVLGSLGYRSITVGIHEKLCEDVMGDIV